MKHTHNEACHLHSLAKGDNDSDSDSKKGT